MLFTLAGVCCFRQDGICTECKFVSDWGRFSVIASSGCGVRVRDYGFEKNLPVEPARLLRGSLKGCSRNEGQKQLPQHPVRHGRRDEPKIKELLSLHSSPDLGNQLTAVREPLRFSLRLEDWFSRCDVFNFALASVRAEARSLDGSLGGFVGDGRIQSDLVPGLRRDARALSMSCAPRHPRRCLLS